MIEQKSRRRFVTYIYFGCAALVLLGPFLLSHVPVSADLENKLNAEDVGVIMHVLTLYCVATSVMGIGFGIALGQALGKWAEGPKGD